MKLLDFKPAQSIFVDFTGKHQKRFTTNKPLIKV